jgi:hypothetical protein
MLGISPLEIQSDLFIPFLPFDPTQRGDESTKSTEVQSSVFTFTNTDIQTMGGLGYQQPVSILTGTPTQATFIHYDHTDYDNDVHMDTDTDNTESGDGEDEVESGEDRESDDEGDFMDTDDQFPKHRPCPSSSRRNTQTYPGMEMEVNGEVSDHPSQWKSAWKSNAPRNRYGVPDDSDSSDKGTNHIGYSFGERELVGFPHSPSLSLVAHIPIRQDAKVCEISESHLVCIHVAQNYHYLLTN